MKPIAIHGRAHIRYDGTDTAIAVGFGTRARCQGKAFQAAHKARFGFMDETKALVVEAVGVEAVGGERGSRKRRQARRRARHAERTAFSLTGSGMMPAIVRREAMKPGQSVAGPAIIIEPNQTSWSRRAGKPKLTARDHLVLRRAQGAPAPRSAPRPTR
jgi:5-oxoprolinase (ATP-hydrolysing)